MFVCLSRVPKVAVWVRALALISDTVLASGSDDDTVKLWDTVTHTCLATLKGHSNSVWALALVSDTVLAFMRIVFHGPASGM